MLQFDIRVTARKVEYHPNKPIGLTEFDYTQKIADEIKRYLEQEITTLEKYVYSDNNKWDDFQFSVSWINEVK